MLFGSSLQCGVLHGKLLHTILEKYINEFSLYINVF